MPSLPPKSRRGFVFLTMAVILVTSKTSRKNREQLPLAQELVTFERVPLSTWL